MIEHSKPTASPLPVVSAGLARRRLLRAGLAAAPVMLALKSQSALATGTHLNCSVWASLSAAKGCKTSHAPVSGKTCKSYDDWASDDTHTECNHKYHDDSNPRTVKVPFTGKEFCDKDLKRTVHTLKNVCKGTDTKGNKFSTGNTEKDELGKHCAAMYLNCKTGNSSVTEAQVKSMWASCKDGGMWTAPGGHQWTRKDCNEYFNYVCKGKTPSGWSMNCAA